MYYVSIDHAIMEFNVLVNPFAVYTTHILFSLKAAMKDNFRGHESGTYQDNRDYSQLVIDCLTAAGEDYYRRST